MMHQINTTYRGNRGATGAANGAGALKIQKEQTY